MVDTTIKNFKELIQKSVGPNKQIVSSSVKPLTAPGENYMGLVLKVEAVLKNERREIEHFSAVAKCVNSKLPEFMRSNAPDTFRKEYGFYSEIVPTLEKFQKEMKLEEKGIIDIFPKLYASRFSLDKKSQVADDDCVLLFEFLGDTGYSNIDRTVGFDLDGAKLILKDLAAFHAIPIAIKLKKPYIFKSKIQKHCISTHSQPQEGNKTNAGGFMQKINEIWYKVLEPYEEVKPYMEKLRERLDDSSSINKSFEIGPKEPFATISHADLWTNNTMQIFEHGKPVKNKFIDFQTFQYFSAAQDLVYFLWTSVHLDTLKEHMDDLIKFYHDNFISLIDKCGCDTTPFNYENFLKEFDEISKMEFGRCLMMQVAAFGKKGEAVFELGKLDVADQMKKELAKMEEKFTLTLRHRVAYMVSLSGKKGWL